MAGGTEFRRKFQIGKETTAGTAVAATTVMKGWGPSVFDPGIDRQKFEGGDGALVMGTGSQFDVEINANLPVDEHPATFEQLGYWFAAGVEGTTTGTRDGTAGSGYIYQYDVVTTARQTPLTYTIEGGDNQRQDEMEYSFVEEMTLKGAKGGPITVSGTWRGRQCTDCSFTTGQSLPSTLEVMKFGKTTVFVEATGGTIGDTQKTCALLGYEVHIVTGHVPIYSADGALYFCDIEQVETVIDGTLTWRHDATGEAEYTAAKTPGTIRLVRLLCEGSALTTAGTAYTYKTFQADMAIEYTGVPEQGAADGISQHDLPFQVVYSADDTPSTATFTIVNNNATYA